MSYGFRNNLMLGLSFLGFTALVSCVSAQSRIPFSYEDHLAERKSRLASLSTLLEKTRSALFDDRARFDHCFMDSSNSRLAGELKAAIKLDGPSSSKLTMLEISPPEEAKDRAEFERCVRIAINRMDIDYEDNFFNPRVAVLSPSWTRLTRTILEPSKVQVPAGEVCMLLIRQFYKFKTWDLRKVEKQIVSDNFDKLGEEDVIVCSNQNIPAHFRWDIQDVKSRYPSANLNGYIVVDAFE
ncbi:MAG TPA: hypothetical protein VE954_33565 [Oligoflexus sp.]|uniref:hypothetical protein n=1 Tax=Oligoflexus sp. TaxID=1971216 RepID=UPI002D7547E0|nr:hypothetical protein [Oligoflexus sp.]HYX38057.1 hypothetical protein [Oligoflexus sp.]